MLRNEATTDTFLKQVDPHVSDWSSIDLRVIAQLEHDGQWHFNGVRALLDPNDRVEPIRRNLPSINGLSVIHERWDIGRLKQLVESISKGELVVGGKTVHLKRWDGQQWQSVVSIDYRFRDREISRSEFGIDFACFTLGVYDSRTRDFENLRILDGALRSHNPPWDGQSDLRQEFLHLPRYKADRTDLASFDVIAPLGVRLGAASEIGGKSLSVSIDALPRIDEGRVKLATISFQSGSNAQRTLHTVDLRSGKRIRLDVPATTSKVTVLLSYRDIDVDRSEVFALTNPRLAVMQQLGISLSVLRSSIEQAQGRELEHWYTVLLQLLGFSPAQYGGTKRSVPDIVAFPEAGKWILIVECTEGEPDLGNKLTKLSTRAKMAGQSAGQIKVYPVLITALSRGLLNQTELEKASKESISVVTADDLGALIQMAIENQGPDQVLGYLQTRIPSTSLGGNYVVRGD